MIDTYHLKSSPFPPVPKFNRSLSLAYFVILIFCVNEVANRISPFSSSVWDLLSDSQLVSTQLNQYVYMYVASFMIWYLAHTLLQCALFLYQKNWEFVLFFYFSSYTLLIVCWHNVLENISFSFRTCGQTGRHSQNETDVNINQFKSALIPNYFRHDFISAALALLLFK